MNRFWIVIFLRDGGGLGSCLFRDESEGKVTEKAKQDFGDHEVVSVEELLPASEEPRDIAQWNIVMESLCGLSKREVMSPDPEQLFEGIYLQGFLRGRDTS